MAYMNDPYVYSDGEYLHIDGFNLSMAVFDELVVMRHAVLDQDKVKLTEIQKRALAHNGGNLGCDALRQSYGLPTNLDLIHQEMGGEG